MTRPRRRALVAIGLGEFVDAYDLIVISGAFFALQSHFRLSSGEVAWLQAAAFFGSAVGALFFGDLADRIGRRRVFVLNLVAFVGLALVSAVVTEVWMLFVVRILIGVAIGADIAASISFLAELSPKGSRGGWTGAMPQITWSLGAICAVLVDAGLYALVGTQSWRLAFAAGALPAVAVLLLRRSLPDSPRWLLAQGRVEEAVAAFEQFGVQVLDHSRLATTPTRPVAVAGIRARVRGWLDPYARLFAGARRHGGGVRDLDDRADPAERDRAERADSVRSAPVWPQPEQGRVDSGRVGDLDRRAGRVVSGLADDRSDRADHLDRGRADRLCRGVRA